MRYINEIKIIYQEDKTFLNLTLSCSSSVFGNVILNFMYKLPLD